MKKTAVLAISLLLLACMTACGKKDPVETPAGQDTAVTAQTETTPDEGDEKEIPEETIGETAEAVSDEAEAPAVTEGKAPEPILFSAGDKLTFADFEMTIEKIGFSYKVDPPNTSGYYRYYKPESGKVYIELVANVYNSSKRTLSLGDLPAFTADYDDGYRYTGFIIVGNGSSFTWSPYFNICDPLSECRYHCLIECPEVVENSEAPLYIEYEDESKQVYRSVIR